MNNNKENIKRNLNEKYTGEGWQSFEMLIKKKEMSCFNNIIIITITTETSNNILKNKID